MIEHDEQSAFMQYVKLDEDVCADWLDLRGELAK
jgi:hypothetical protein